MKHNLLFSSTLFLFLAICGDEIAAQSKLPSQEALEKMSTDQWKNQIRREKFDLVLPKIMRDRKVDMWVHIMREPIEDPFGKYDLGSASGVFVFTDRGGDRIERAIVGRRWGNSQRGWRSQDSNYLEKSGAYDIIGASVFVVEPIADPMTEYDYRFKGLREFVDARDPKVIAVNYREVLGPWATEQEINDGISLTDYRLLVSELGEKYASRIVSSEYLTMDYQVTPVPSEVKMLKKMRKDELKLVAQVFDAIEPGKTPIESGGQVGVGSEEAYVVAFRRMSTGLSQRGRSAGWENTVVQGGDIIAATSQGLFAYVLREGEKEPPAEIQKLWKEYLKIDKVFAETIRADRTSREIVKDYTERLKKMDVEVEAFQMHMFPQKNNFPAYSDGYDSNKTILSVDHHGKGMGATGDKHDIYLGPRIGSYGPDWVLDVPLADNHHFVLEYFFYMPSPGPEGKDQYLLFWNHEQAIVRESGVEYLSPPQKDLILIK
jgi:hypothetical protein|tara:strand:+ start:22840 stop:24306 length:1467 start_codon:yes stop_codon:yes gene_type:complete